MQSSRYLLFRSGSESCALPLSCVREIARHSVLASVDSNAEFDRGRVNARGEIAKVIVPGGGEIENLAICILAELEDGRLGAFVADEIQGVHEDRGSARLLLGERNRFAA